MQVTRYGRTGMILVSLSLLLSSSTVHEVGQLDFATLFRLTYIAVLQALHVIPRTPSPVPLEDRPEDELSPEELRELVKRLKVSMSLGLRTKVLIDTGTKDSSSQG